MSDTTPDTTPAETDSTVLTDNTDSTVTDGDATEAEASAVTGDNADSDTTEGEAGNGSQDTTSKGYADFTAPEGMELDGQAIAAATPLFQELGLTQEQAQKLVDFQSQQVKAASESQVEAFSQLKKDWGDQAKSDTEYGGDKFDENIGVARVALDKFGTPELSKLMDEFGVGNHPEMIRFMVRVGRTVKEDVPGGNTDAPSAKKDRVSLLYPTTAQ